MAQRRRGRCALSSGAAWALSLCLIGWGAPAAAATLAEVRVGRHPGFTRVVLELDAPAGYRLEASKPGEEPPRLRIALEAESPPRRLAPRDALVRAVRVTPAERGSEVEVELGTRDVHVTEMILGGPPRIVLDLRRRPPESASEPEAPIGAKQQIGSAPAREASAPESAAPEATHPPAESRPPEKPPGAPVGPANAAEAAPAPPAEPAPEAAREPPSAPEPEAARQAPPAAAPEAAPLRAAEASRGGPGSVSDAPRGGTDLRRHAGRALIVLGVAILLLVWVRLRSRARARRRAAEEIEPALLEAGGRARTPDRRPAPAAFPGPPADEPITMGAPGGVEATAGGPFEAPGEKVPPPTAETAAARPESPAPAPGPEPPRAVPAVEERLARLEARLQDLLESQERLEHQLRSHTEELRVQRAAIARTQRVVRTLVRPEGATEPVPRAPGGRPE